MTQSVWERCTLDVILFRDENTNRIIIVIFLYLEDKIELYLPTEEESLQ